MIRFNIKYLRLERGMTQKELIELSNIRPQTLSEYENNKAKTISIEHLNMLCDIFDCQPGDIMEYGATPEDFKWKVVKVASKRKKENECKGRSYG